MIKSKIRDEMKDAIKKDRYLNKDDAQLIGSFLDKIQQEITLQKLEHRKYLAKYQIGGVSNFEMCAAVLNKFRSQHEQLF